MFIHSLLYIIIFVGLLISVGDMIYFGKANKRLGFEIYVVMGNFYEIVFIAIQKYLVWLILFIAFQLLLFILWIRLLKKFLLKWEGSHNILYHYIVLILFCVFAIISIRGGLQSRPLKPAMAFQDDNMFLGFLALNGLYNAITAIYKNEGYFIVNQNYNEIKKTSRSLIYSPDVKYPSPKYIFYRKMHSKPKTVEKKYNVVIIVMESWGYKDLGMNGHPYKSTPFFDSLAKEGLLFKRHYSVAQRTIPLLHVVISSIPSLYGIVYSRSSYQSNHQTGLASIFKKKNYRTIFVYSAKKDSMGFSSYAPLIGFDTVITKNSFDLKKVKQDGVWGVYDEYAFKRLHDEISKHKSPFFAMLKSVHPHIPFSIPSHRKGLIKNKANDHELGFYDDMRYTDQCLQEFFSIAKKSWYFKNTLFIIFGDHGYNYKEGIDRFHTPLLFYAPGLITPGVSDVIASQLDIMPTVLDLLNIKTFHFSIGNSLFHKQKSPSDAWAILDFDNLMGWIQGDLVLLSSPDKIIGLFDHKKDSQLTKNMMDQKEMAKKSIQMQKNWFDLLSAISYSILQNKITPPVKPGM